MMGLLQLASTNGISASYSRRLLKILKSEQKVGLGKDVAISTSRLIEPLSKRELEVLKMLATELTGPEIANELNIEISTVRYHTNNIYGKLSVHNRRQAINRAQELELL